MTGAAEAFAEAEAAVGAAAARVGAAAGPAAAADGLAAVAARADAAVARAEAAVAAARVAAEEEDLPQTVREFEGRLRALAARCQQERRRLADAKRAARVASEQRHAAERTALLAGARGDAADAADAASARRRMLDQASLLDTSRDVTASLRRTRETMAREIRRLTETESLLDKDAKTMQSTYDEYASYKSAAGRSDAVLKELQYQEKLDKIAIISGFSLFLLVVIYIVWKRTLGWIVPTSFLISLFYGKDAAEETVDA